MKFNKLPRKGIKCAYCGCETSVHTRITFDMDYMTKLNAPKILLTFCCVEHYRRYKEELKND